jgi:hypothetical protein
MDRTVELVPLLCVKCSTPVPAEPDEVAWVCAQCGQGLLLDEDKGLVPLEVHYSAGIAPNALGKPFWVAEGRVNLYRKAYDSSDKEAEQSSRFWSQPRQFFVPAFSSPLGSLLVVAVDYLIQPPDLKPGDVARFEPVTLHQEDVRSAAEFIVVAVEAQRKDKVKQVDFNLQLSLPVLWVLP